MPLFWAPLETPLCPLPIGVRPFVFSILTPCLNLNVFRIFGRPTLSYCWHQQIQSLLPPLALICRCYVRITFFFRVPFRDLSISSSYLQGNNPRRTFTPLGVWCLCAFPFSSHDVRGVLLIYSQTGTYASAPIQRFAFAPLIAF